MFGSQEEAADADVRKTDAAAADVDTTHAATERDADAATTEDNAEEDDFPCVKQPLCRGHQSAPPLRNVCTLCSHAAAPACRSALTFVWWALLPARQLRPTLTHRLQFFTIQALAAVCSGAFSGAWCGQRVLSQGAFPLVLKIDENANKIVEGKCTRLTPKVQKLHPQMKEILAAEAIRLKGKRGYPQT